MALWCLSYWFVVKKSNEYMREKGYPISIEEMAPTYGRIILFFVAPAFAIWFLWIDLKFAIIMLYVTGLNRKNSSKEQSKEE